MLKRRLKLFAMLSSFSVISTIIVFVFVKKNPQNKNFGQKNYASFDVGNLITNKSSKAFNKKKLAVIVPFRDTFEELKIFVPYMSNFLSAQEIPFHIFVIQQIDDFRFNRAALTNVGYFYTRKEFHYLAQHDIDYLPLNPKIPYQYPSRSVFHLVPYFLRPECKTPKYRFTNFGGIVLIPFGILKSIGGFCNSFWGWGGEDLSFKKSLVRRGVKVKVLGKSIGSDCTNTFHHLHTYKKRPRDKKRCQKHAKLGKKCVGKTGPRNLDYKIESVEEIKVKNAQVTFLNVRLFCDEEKTPWCSKDCEEIK